MVDWPFLFIIVALVAAVLGGTGVVGEATIVAWMVFVAGLILFYVALKAEKRRTEEDRRRPNE